MNVVVHDNVLAAIVALKVVISVSNSICSNVRHIVPQKSQKIAKSPKKLFDFLSNLNLLFGV